MRTEMATWKILLLGAIGWAMLPQTSQARQDDPATPREKIEAEFQKGLRVLETKRLEQLFALAKSQSGAEAQATYEDAFRFALQVELYKEAEPIAEAILKSNQKAPVLVYLAQIVNVMAEADRGEFEPALQSIMAAVQRGERERAGGDERVQDAALPVSARLSLMEAFYQRLMHSDQVEIARKAFTILAESASKTDEAALETYAKSRLQQLNLIGRPAPPIEGTDQDNQPFQLAGLRGQVVLVVFWATWCIPSDEQADWLEELHDRYQDQGLRIVSVNLDLHQESGVGPESIAPNIRRFLLDHNVTWPNLIDTPGEDCIATRYGINDIPASVLIGKDGAILDLDLSRTNAETAIRKALDAGK